MTMEVVGSTGAFSVLDKAGAVRERTGASTVEPCDWTALGAAIEGYRRELLPIAAGRAFRLGDFTLSSGKRSTHYVDGKQVTLAHPEGALLFARIILKALEHQHVDAIGGLTIGADPIVGGVVVLSALEGKPIPGFIVRKEAKKHGLQKDIEGGTLASGARAVVIDDVVTTGTSLLDAIGKVEECGAHVVGVLALTDRQEGGKELLERQGYPVFAVFTAEELKREKRCQEALAT